MSIACTIAAFLVLIVGLFAVIIERTAERDEARETVRRLESECNAHAAENARLTGGGVVLPGPWVAPRSDSWLEQIMDEQERTWAERHGDGGSAS